MTSYIGFSWGGTRLVFLVGNYAVKIPRIRLLRPFFRLFQLTKEKRAKQTLRENYDSNLFRAALKYLFNGVLANRREWKVWKITRSPLLAEVKASLFFSLVLIQRRGETAIPMSQIEAHKYWQQMLVEEQGDVKKAKGQFVVIDNRCVLADFGHPDLNLAALR